MNDLDRLARDILAVAFSSCYPGDHREQLFVSQRTIAVARHGGKIYVASNDVYSGAPSELQRDNVATSLEGQGIRGEVIYLTNWAYVSDFNSRDYHAEIQLMDYFCYMRLPLPQIGVSKPCCSRCSRHLNQLQIDHSYYHRQPIGHVYKAPKASAKWW